LEVDLETFASQELAKSLHGYYRPRQEQLWYDLETFASQELAKSLHGYYRPRQEQLWQQYW